MAELKRIVCVVRVEESGPPPRVMVDRTFAGAGAEAEPATPIEPGTVELRAAVARTVEVAP